MAESDLKRIVLPPRPALQEELPLVRHDEQFRRFAGAARVFDDRFDDPHLKMRHHNGELVGGGGLPGAPLGRTAPRPGNGGAGHGVALTWSASWLHQTDFPGAVRERTEGIVTLP